MVSRQQQSIIISGVILAVSVLMVSVYFASDLNSSMLFLIKAILQPASFAILIFFISLALWLRTRLIVLATTLACLINLPFLLPNISNKEQIENKAESIKIATFSTLTRTENVKDIASFITSSDADLICLQEVSLAHRQLLSERLNGIYPYVVENGNNQLILSRFKLTVGNDTGYYHTSSLQHPEWGLISIINAHMSRPYRTKGVSKEWSELFETLDNELPTILCGDLNITPNNTYYDLLRYRYRLNDAHTSGYGFTYPSGQRRSSLFGVLIRIDYIFSRGFESFDTYTQNASLLSDHKAVVSNLVFIDQKNN